jgi:dTDP-glucose pyrophosphorylase/CBS domain-containing protein
MRVKKKREPERSSRCRKELAMKGALTNADRITVNDGASFKEAIQKINEEKSGIALVVNEKACLIGVITDGDIRRSILKGITLEDRVTLAMTRNPITARPNYTKGELFRMMIRHQISHIPVVDERTCLLGIVFEDSLRRESLLTIPVVVMAGGLGTRLRPLTEKIPKPMLKVNGKPMLEGIIERFRDLGVEEFYISVNYKSEVIENYFGDGSPWRIKIQYLREKKRLGTAGSLSLLPKNFPSAFFVVNADIVTDLDFRAIYQFHRDNDADLSVAVKKFSYQVPYGTIEVEHGRIVSLAEKPQIKKYVNAGIYILEPEIVPEIPADQFFDMPDLINRSINEGKVVSSYLIHGTWVDVGQKKDYYRANGTADPEGDAQWTDQERAVEKKRWENVVEVR